MNRLFSRLRPLLCTCLVIPFVYGTSVAAHTTASSIGAESPSPVSAQSLEADLVLARYLLSNEDFHGAKYCARNAYDTAANETRRREARQLLEEIDTMQALCLRILWHEARQSHANCDWEKMRRAVTRILQISPDNLEAQQVRKWMKQRGIIRYFSLL
ncbi:hypothetical protein [Ruficoccus sp. ZRK36]|uniref:hypothetical protein n=1 Tax=Ruficoccus sp. ZRK36 TaxID=2866311 RepID=UPI001C73C2BC|nr:hypothetical protein [Ruficoccus sp. ZRK36]QYY37308.1 hypothetical protein K0V07_07435 [Ruficoccus sp. ZRK36]